MSIPIYFWNETVYRAAICAFLGRQVISAHVGFFVNSAAHMFGQKPFNSKIEPNDSPWVSIAVFGEG